MAQPVRPDDSLHEDEIIEVTPKAASSTGLQADYFTRYRTPITVAAVAVILVLLGFAYYRMVLLPERNQEALEQMAVAVRFFEQDSLDRAIRGTSQYPGLEMLVEDYGGTEAGNLSRYYLGMAYLKQGKYAEGLEQLQAFDKSGSIIAANAYAGIAYAHEEQKDFAAAALAYQDAAEVKANRFTSPYFLNHAARCLEEAQQLPEALRLYRRIRDEYPTSPEAQSVPRDIGRLEAATGDAE